MFVHSFIHTVLRLVCPRVLPPPPRVSTPAGCTCANPASRALVSSALPPTCYILTKNVNQTLQCAGVVAARLPRSPWSTCWVRRHPSTLASFWWAALQGPSPLSQGSAPRPSWPSSGWLLPAQPRTWCSSGLLVTQVSPQGLRRTCPR